MRAVNTVAGTMARNPGQDDADLRIPCGQEPAHLLPGVLADHQESVLPAEPASGVHVGLGDLVDGKDVGQVEHHRHHDVRGAQGKRLGCPQKHGQEKDGQHHLGHPGGLLRREEGIETGGCEILVGVRRLIGLHMHTLGFPEGLRPELLVPASVMFPAPGGSLQPAGFSMLISWIMLCGGGSSTMTANTAAAPS